MRIDFQQDYDVVVAGGGIAGVAAALAAAENGSRTALVEKTGFLGGLATLGMVYFYLPICDGRGTQVGFGLAEKLLRASVKYGPEMPLENWKTDFKNYRFRTTFSPASFILAMEELLADAGVTIWYDTLITAATALTGQPTELLVRNKGGNGKFLCNVVVDATGDAEIARETGCNFAVGDNTLSLWGVEYNEDSDDPEHWSRLGANLRGIINGRISPENLPYSAISPRGATEFLLDSRKWLRSVYAAPETSKARRFPVLMPGMPDFRTSARIEGQFLLQENTHNTRFQDSIGMAADWSNTGVVQEIPYGTMLPSNGANLLVAGRCISAAGYAWELTRSIPAVAVTGEAAGTAAALSIQGNCTVHQLPVNLLQQKLYDRGCKLHLSDVGLPYRGEDGYIPSTIKFESH